MHRPHREFWLSSAAIVVVTAGYALAYQQAASFPAASGLVGHAIGVVGFILMLMTETLYSIRKRMTDARWGSMARWLRFHMATGVVGPYMVLLHTSMKFQGLAGVAMLLTVVVVISGFVGRYIYTSVPRVEAAAGPAAEAPERIQSRRRALANWYSWHVPLTWALFVTAGVHAAAALYYATLQR